jgi:hypothetical protein
MKKIKNRPTKPLGFRMKAEVFFDASTWYPVRWRLQEVISMWWELPYGRVNGRYAEDGRKLAEQ